LIVSQQGIKIGDLQAEEINKVVPVDQSSTAIDELRNEFASFRSNENALRGAIDEISASAAAQQISADLRNRVDDLESQVDALRPPLSWPSTEQFSAPTLLNSWVNLGAPYNPAGYYKDPFGRVHLRGMIKSGTVGLTVFTLPVGYRPANSELIATASNGAFGILIIDNAGNATINAGTNSYFSLDNITFRAA
jgi:hypothetical protein